MSRKKPTAKQHAFLEFLKDHVQETGVWPTYREIADHFGYRSPNSVTQNLQALHKKGLLTRDESGYDFSEKVDLSDEPVGIPVRGIIAAGGLQEAIETDLGAITLETLFPNLHRMFALRVSGQSMQDVGIDDGDYVFLTRDAIPQGGIGAVRYNDETSLKRIYREKDGLRLEPANEAYKAIHIEPGTFEEVTVLGRYVGHMTDEGIFRRPGRLN